MRVVRLLAIMVMLCAPAQDAVVSQECSDWQACRQLALEAAERQDYDGFHDLAWRAVRAGPTNDPGLMTMLARAQSLSGRPHDAIVMLQRLADMGVATDAATSDDFRRVRALPGWADLEARIAGRPTPTTTTTEVRNTPTPEAPRPADTKLKRETTAAPTVPKAETPAKPAAPSPPAPLSFSTADIDPTGLAYDAVSGRFIVGDRQGRKLAVIGERSRRLANLAGVDGGLGDITAFEIDAREGDLWVVSPSSVHKLQLISGRVLAPITLPASLDRTHFADVAITPGSAVIVLDSTGRRLFRLGRKGRTLELAARLAASDLVSIAPASETVVYSAYDRGVVRVDLEARTMGVVESSDRVDLSGLTWIRWHRGALVGIQKVAEGTHRIVRIKLDGTGRTARSLDVLEDGVAVAGPTAATLSGNVMHYLRIAPGSTEVTVSRHLLK